jgi:hypothetical protein
MSDSVSDIIRADRTNQEAKIEYARIAVRARRWFKLVLTKVKKDRSSLLIQYLPVANIKKARKERFNDQ